MTAIVEPLPALERPAWRARLVIILAGIAQGAAVYVGAAAPGWIDPALVDDLAVLVLSAALVVQMTWPVAEADWPARRRALAAALVTGLLIAICHHWATAVWQDSYFGPGPEIFLGAALFLSLPLLQGIVAGAFRPPNYEQLFTRFVDIALALLIGAISLGIYLVLRHLWANLFEVLELEPVKEVLSSNLFTSFSDAAAWTLGILVTRESSGILDRLLRLCTALARGLLPVLVAIGGSLFLALPFTGLDPLWKEGGGSGLLLGIAAFAILLINGVYQTGSQHYPGWQKRLVEAAIVVLAAAAGLAAYGATLRVEQHGLTPERVHLLALVGTTVLVSVGYLAAMLLARRPWLVALGRVNSIALPIIVLLLLAMTSPVLDPVSLSAWSQYRRLADGTVPAKEFDFGYLQFRLGEAGKERLAALKELSDHPEADQIRDGIAAVRRFDSYWKWTDSRRRGLVKPPVPSVPRRLLSPSAATPAARQALQALREEIWGEEIARLVGQPARGALGPFAITGTTRWRAGDSPRLYVVLTGWVSVKRQGLSHPSGIRVAGPGVPVFHADPGETLELKTEGPAAILVVELEHAR